MNEIHSAKHIKLAVNPYAKEMSAQEGNDLFYRLTCDPEQAKLILECATMAEIEEVYMPGEVMTGEEYGEIEGLDMRGMRGDAIFEAVSVRKFSKTAQTMAALARAMNRALEPKGFSVGEAIIGKPRRTGLFATVTVQFPISDGQVLSIIFHSPEGSKMKIAMDDEILAFRWLLNKRDITVAVSPEGEGDVSLVEVGKRVAIITEKNAAKFAAKKEEIQVQRESLAAVQEQLATAQGANDTVRAEVEQTIEASELADGTAESLRGQIEKTREFNNELENKLNSLKEKKGNTDGGGSDNGDTQTEKKFTVGGIDFTAVRFQTPRPHWRFKIDEIGEVYEVGTGGVASDSVPKMISSLEDMFNRLAKGDVDEWRKQWELPVNSGAGKNGTFSAGDTVYFKLASSGEWAEANYRGPLGEDQVVVVYKGQNWTLGKVEIFKTIPEGGGTKNSGTVNPDTVDGLKKAADEAVASMRKARTGEIGVSEIPDIRARFTDKIKSLVADGDTEAAAEGMKYLAETQEAGGEIVTQSNPLWEQTGVGFGTAGAKDKDLTPITDKQAFIALANSDDVVTMTEAEYTALLSQHKLNQIDSRNPVDTLFAWQVRNRIEKSGITDPQELMKKFLALKAAATKDADSFVRIGLAYTIEKADGYDDSKELKAIRNDVVNGYDKVKGMIEQIAAEGLPLPKVEVPVDAPAIDTPAVTTLNDILAGKYATSDEIGTALDKAAGELEAAGKMDEYDALLNKAADYLTDVLAKEAM
jgi:hypothetical protein